MKLFPFKRSKKECFLVLDIGTEAVKALVVEKANQQYSVLGSAVKYLDELRPFDNNKIVTEVKDEAIKSSGKLPRGLLLSLPPDILKSRVRVFNIRRKNPEIRIGKTEAETLRDSAFKGSEKEASEYFAKNSGILPQDLRFVDSEIVGLKIDGYEVPDILGYSGKVLEFKVLVSFLPFGYLNNFNRVFKQFNLKFQKVVSPIKNLNSLGLKEGIFIDIGGEVTAIVVLKNGKIDFIDEFEMGGKDFSRTISQALGMRQEAARILKERYSARELSEETRQRINEILSPSVAEWHASLQSKLKLVKGMPPDIFYILGAGGFLPEIEEILSEEDREVKTFHLHDFKNIVDGRGVGPQFINSMLLFYGK